MDCRKRGTPRTRGTVHCWGRDLSLPVPESIQISLKSQKPGVAAGSVRRGLQGLDYRRSRNRVQVVNHVCWFPDNAKE